MTNSALLRSLAAAAIALAAGLAALPADAAGRAHWRTFPARRVAGPQSLDGTEFVARTQEEWAAAWRGSGAPERLPRVDFARRMVVGVRSGGADGCHGFRLVALRIGREAAEVLWQPTYASDAICTSAVWTGWRFATVPRTARPLTFRSLPVLVTTVGR